jgi:hypothetical protein
VLSRDLLECLDHAELEAIVAHEMAHINSHDVHLLVGAGLLRDVVAWNPFAHLALRHLSADRELEADRQAAAITRNPLAVASGLLKMCELMRTRRRLMAGVSVAFVRPRGAMTKRVSSLIRVADGKAPVARAGWGPYIGAACVAAVLGLAVGARVARNDGAALAVVLGAPQSSSAELQSFEDLRGLKRPPPGRRAEKATTAKASERRARATKAPPLGRLAVAPVALSERDFPKWVAAIAALAKSRGIPPEQVRREVRENWHAIPLLPSHPPAPIGIYTMELRP